MFRTRLISGIVLVILAVAVIVLGGPVLAAVLAGISLIGMSELNRALTKSAGISALNTVGYLGCIGYYLVLYGGFAEFALGVILLTLIVAMAVYVFTYPTYRIEQVIPVIFGLLYVGVMLSCIYRLREMDRGVYLVWLIFLSSWGSDTCAYCVGKLFGKHRMTPRLSPKKSVEGGVGGVFGAALLGVAFALAMRENLGGNYAPAFALICAVGALISMVGDLAASAIKRNHDIKDYGTLIPGHGGILDRFDSVIFVAPVIYYLLQLVGGF